MGLIARAFAISSRRREKMRPINDASADLRRLDLRGLEQLVAAVQEQGYVVIAPVEKDAAIVFERIGSVEALPRGLTDQQAPGSYRLLEDDASTRFAYCSGPSSLKRFLFPSRLPLWQAKRDGDRIAFVEPASASEKYAFLGARPCDLAAVEKQDQVFLQSGFSDHDYQRRRNSALFIAVNCLHPSDVCFCASFGSGPKAQSGYDLLLTELLDGDELCYLVEAGSQQGDALLDLLSLPIADQALVDTAAAALQAAERRIERRLDPEATRQALRSAAESPAWEEIAQRCLGCANCTLVCPTCFCSTVEDHTTLEGDIAHRDRVWDSCFQPAFSFVAGGPVRVTLKSRYRQWLTHKLSAWFDQFGSSGCVGCGRCVAWCPVGIDLLESVESFTAPVHQKTNAKKGVSS